MSWDHHFDLVVIGSGAAGMSAALRAHDLGSKVVVLEKSPAYGGSTAMSGGVVWVPNNPQMGPKGIADSREDSLAYLRGIIAGEVPDERIQAYVDESLRVLAYLAEHSHLHLDALEHYTDYYPELPGGQRGGRSMEPIPFDASLLGEEFERLRRPHPQSQVMGKFGITAREAHGYLAADLGGKLRLLWRLIQYGLRWPKRRRYGRDTLITAGNALIARLRRSLLDREVPIWLECGARDLVVEEGRVAGVLSDRGRIEARGGVLLAAGGFERNPAMRKEHQPLAADVEWNAGNHFNQGAGIRMGQAAGGQLALMDEAWWTPVTKVPKSDYAWVLVVEKNLPGGIFVDQRGRRFTNEAAPYLDVVKGMHANDTDCAWLVFDAEFRRLYPVGPVAPGYAQPDQRLSRRLREGFLTRAKSVRELAEKLELPVQAFEDTIARFNANAAEGVDPDFQRGESHADRYYGDPRVRPNPCLRPIEVGPFYAIPVFPGDLGTKGGLVTDPQARVLDEAGTPIQGLFAAGNCSSAVMGRSYPGAGGTIGPALTFGFIAAETAAETAAQGTPAHA